MDLLPALMITIIPMTLNVAGIRIYERASITYR